MVQQQDKDMVNADTSDVCTVSIGTRAVERLIFLIALIARLIILITC